MSGQNLQFGSFKLDDTALLIERLDLARFLLPTPCSQATETSNSSSKLSYYTLRNKTLDLFVQCMVNRTGPDFIII